MEDDGRHRVELTRMLDDAEAGRLDEIIFYEMERAAREEYVYYATRRILMRLEVPLWFCGSDMDHRTADGAPFFGMKQTEAATFSRRHAEKMSIAYDARLARGYPAPGNPPYAWRWQSQDSVPRGGRRGFERVDDETEWLKWAMQQVLSGRSLSDVAGDLTAKAITRHGSTFWDSSVLRLCLTNPIHAGLVRQRDDTFVEGAHWEQRLWSPEDRELLMERLRARRSRGGRRFSHPHFLLNGSLKCSHCGRLVGAQTHPNGQRHYQCRREHNRKGQETCPGVRRIAEPIEEFVVGEIRRVALSDDVQELARQEARQQLEAGTQDLGQQRTKLRRKLHALQAKEDGLIDMRYAEEIDAVQFREQNERARAEKRQLQFALDEVQGELDRHSTRELELSRVEQALKRFDQVFDALGLDERKQLLEEVIEKLTMERAGDDSGDVIVRLKLVGLPEASRRIVNFGNPKMTSGPGSLTPRQLACVKLSQAGLSFSEIGRRWRTTPQNAQLCWCDLCRKLGTYHPEEIYTSVAERIAEAGDTLPLDGRVRGVRGAGQDTGLHLSILKHLADGKSLARFIKDAKADSKSVYSAVNQMMGWLGVTTQRGLVEEALRDFGQESHALDGGSRRQTPGEAIQHLRVERADDGSGDVLVRLQLAGLPERTRRIPNSGNAKPKVGVASLSDRELDCVRLKREGLSRTQIGQKWGTTPGNASTIWKNVRAKLGTDDPAEIFRLTAARIEAAGDTLPVGRVRSVRRRR